MNNIESIDPVDGMTTTEALASVASVARNSPSGAEIISLAYDCNALPEVITDKSLIAFSHALLAKYGAPVAAQEPVEWRAFADNNGPVPLEISGLDEKACRHAVLTNARSAGWKGTVEGYLMNAGWTIRPLYTAPQPTSAPHKAFHARVHIETLAGMLAKVEESKRDIVNPNNSVDYVRIGWGGWALLRAAIIDVIEDAVDPQPSAQPIDIILHCPACGTQHIDQADETWTNPPHRSHLCHSCGHIWRPADVATNGVAAIKTRGERDSATQPTTNAQPAASAEPVVVYMYPDKQGYVVHGTVPKDTSLRPGNNTLYTAPVAAQTSVPDGWKLVPVDPTEIMVISGFESAPDQHFSSTEEWERYEAMTGCQQAAYRAEKCWASMLAAAPTPPAVGQAMQLAWRVLDRNSGKPRTDWIDGTGGDQSAEPPYSGGLIQRAFSAPTAAAQTQQDVDKVDARSVFEPIAKSRGFADFARVSTSGCYKDDRLQDLWNVTIRTIDALLLAKQPDPAASADERTPEDDLNATEEVLDFAMCDMPKSMETSYDTVSAYAWAIVQGYSALLTEARKRIQPARGEDARDAARYRWLAGKYRGYDKDWGADEDDPGRPIIYFNVDCESFFDAMNEGGMAAAIDAAMQQGGQS